MIIVGGPRNAYQKEKIIYDIVSSSSEPVSFNDIVRIAKKDYNLTSGAVQAAINRCLKQEAIFPIYEKKVMSIEKNRVLRYFSTNTTAFSDVPHPDINDLLNSYGKIQKGELIFTEDDAILPLYLPSDQAHILQSLVEFSEEYRSVGDLFSKALMDFLKNNIPKEILIQAIQKSNETGSDASEIQSDEGNLKNVKQISKQEDLV